MKTIVYNVILVLLLKNSNITASSDTENEREQCSTVEKSDCAEENKNSQLYDKTSNTIYMEIEKALNGYKPCTIIEEKESVCKCYQDVIESDLRIYEKTGVKQSMLDATAKYGTRYQIIDHHLYRDPDVMFPARSSGIEKFLLNLLPKLNDTELIINTRDWPQIPATYHGGRGPIFSFSKTNEYHDIMYPAWTFWAGGPAITLHPTGIGRWDLMRTHLLKAADEHPWSMKQSKAFFRGSRTSDERDSLVLLSRRKPDLVDAKYTKNQAWKSPKDTLNAEPAKEVSFEDHCQYKYLFNFRGVAASFRFKHLFLCKSLVFHVGNEWNEFFYFAMKPWVHYVPLKSYPNEKEIEEILVFFQQHDKLAQEIASRGFEFIRNHLNLEEVECYWEKLLNRYNRLLQFVVERNKNLIEIKSKVK